MRHCAGNLLTPSQTAVLLRGGKAGQKETWMNWTKLLILPLAVAAAGRASTIIDISAAAGGGGGSCSSVARYTYDQGGGVVASSAPCGGSVTPVSPGATSATLLATTTGGGSLASASFDLSTGIVRAGFDSAPGIGGGSVTGTLRDGVTFNNSNASPAVIAVTWDVTGSLGQLLGTDNAFDVYFQGVLGGSATYTWHFDTNNGVSVNNVVLRGYENSSTQQLNSEGLGFSVVGFYTLSPGLNPLSFQESLQISGSYGTLDLGHTIQVGLVLPGGVTYTSDSGAFLTAQASVPEPGTLAVSGTALLGLACLLRMRAKRGWGRLGSAALAMLPRS